ncbi:hypothetical protein HMN09_00613500 [Mycena chlorophos]|uniref:G-patch domain-containing protein n=1 Tax=Mycena chlorophos TaxID=658473 RepID=A0A8H6T5P4_MYCCL|nr:hypothetical protein HMN09_00613500 [Mycena chlorophos]
MDGPVERPLKRPRSIDEEDDNISLVSRSPSPLPMDVDTRDPYKYDEYSSKPLPPETITAETRIKPTNRGFAMLAKLGWREGQPLGLSEDGRVDPVPLNLHAGSLGLGRLTQDFRVIETTVSQRRDMDSERMTKESDEQRQTREDNVARSMVLQNELSSTIKAFYCELCDKQFTKVAAYTEHTNSYAHHHKARFKDMQSSMRGTQDDADKRKEKERKREERELRKLAAAKGIKLAKSAPAAPAPPMAAAPPAPPAPNPSDMDIDGEPINPPPASGWIPVPPSEPSTSTAPPALAVPEPAIVAQPPAPATVEQPTGKAHASRLGWQQFQKKRR